MLECRAEDRLMGATACEDCGLPYGDEHGFPDLLIPDDVWLAISPSGTFGGLLCPNCICKRLHDRGIDRVEGRFGSGPLAVTYEYPWTPRPVDTRAPRRSRDELADADCSARNLADNRRGTNR